MGKKKNKSEGEKQQSDQKNTSNDGGKKDGGSTTVILRIEMHCDGCATQVIKRLRSFEGVETVKGDEKDANKVTVTGKVDPSKLREKLEQKTKKKVELLSPLPKKDKDKDKESGGGEKKTEDKTEKKPDEKKSKEPPVTTAVLKMDLHCDGCVKKIRKTVTKTKGCQEMSIDRQKDLVTVKGAMDMKALAESLKEKLRKPVEIVPPKKEGGGEKKEKGGGGGEKGKGGGEGKAAGDGGGHGGGKAEENRLEYVPYGYTYPYGYGPGYVANFNAPQMFSDENPNACSVM